MSESKNSKLIFMDYKEVDKWAQLKEHEKYYY